MNRMMLVFAVAIVACAHRDPEPAVAVVEPPPASPTSFTAGPPPSAAPVASAPDPSADGGPVYVSDADEVIASLRPRFRACYNTGLQLDPSIQGKVVISAKVNPDGTVASSNVASLVGLTPEVATCIATTVERATFSAPRGGGSTLNIPVSFVQQKTGPRPPKKP